jgi:hypothetical protein
MVGALLLGVVLVSAFWLLADEVAKHDVRGVAARDRSVQLRIARDAARGRLVQIGAGLLALGAYIYTVRNFRLARRQNEMNQATLRLTERQILEQMELSRQTLELARQQATEQAEANRRTLELARQQATEQAEANRQTLELGRAAQLTERYAKAIEQLSMESSDSRLGALYSLERIARDSPEDRAAVIEVLDSFVQRPNLPQHVTRTAAAVSGRLRLAANRDRAGKPR